MRLLFTSGTGKHQPTHGPKAGACEAAVKYLTIIIVPCFASPFKRDEEGVGEGLGWHGQRSAVGRGNPGLRYATTRPCLHVPPMPRRLSVSSRPPFSAFVDDSTLGTSS